MESTAKTAEKESVTQIDSSIPHAHEQHGPPLFLVVVVVLVVDVVVVTLRGREIPVSYRVLQKGGEWLVYDVNVEGVSLVNNYRSQIGSILNNSSYEALVARIRAKLAAGQADQGAKGRRRAKEDAL